MTPTPSLQLESFKDYEEFCNLLHDRLHALLLHLEDLDNNSFMLHMNLIPRHDPNRVEASNYFLAGADSQKKIFEEDLSLKENQNTIYEPHWKFLKETFLDPNIPGLETGKFNEAFLEGSLSTKGITPGTLSTYFQEFLINHTFPNEFQQHEFPIFSAYFNLDTDFFLSVPLIPFGNVEGVIHILFKESQFRKLDSDASLKRIIKLFSFQYEELLLAWENKEENVYQDF